MSRGTSAHALSRKPPPPSRAEPCGTVAQDQLLEAVSALEDALAHVRQTVTAEGWNEAQRIAHQVIVAAEQGGFSEVANAVLHVEDAVAAVTDGELMPDSATFRQIDAALRSARAACAMPEAQDGPVETPQSRGTVWLVCDSAELGAELLRAIPKKQLEGVAVARGELRARLSASTPDALIVELGSDEPGDFIGVLADLKQRAPRTALIALSEDGSYRARIAAAQLGAVLYFLLPVSAEKVATALETLDIGTLHERPRVLALALNGSIDWLRNPLEAEGMELKIFHQPELVLEALDASQPSALVLDQGTNPGAGKHLCRLVRAAPRWRDLPILARAKPLADAWLAGFEAGADDMLPFDVTPSELLARLRVRLDRTRVFREQSNRDALTGLLTRRAFTESVLARIAEAQRSRRHLSLCLMDLDRFKSINDSYGHGAGDKVLSAFGALLGTRFRLQDLRGRWGGEEFVVGFYGEWAESAREILSRVTAEFAKISFDGGHGRSFNVTVSGGIATYPIDGKSLDELVAAADERLYAAKLAGRDRIKI
jgi:diguanylate cyclase (GGDEF)-like protein